MKQAILFLVITLLAGTSCGARQETDTVLSATQVQNQADLLNFYRQYSQFTDPGDHVHLYENLPDSLEALCHIIRSQFIHPYAELPRYRDQIPEERWNEFPDYPTVESILKGLLSHDASGLIKDRKPKDRLVLGCRHNAILLASVMKHRGIPARVRTGHAAYLRPGFKLSHTLCEIWNENENRWMLVDPITGMIDFNRNQFEFSHKLWFKLQRGGVDLDTYGFPGRYTGLISIVGKISPDLAAILGTEYPVFHYAPMLDDVREKNELSQEHTDLLNRVCKLMGRIDAENLAKLQKIYENTPEMQITKTFNLNAGQTESKVQTGQYLSKN